jgi:hypothetical protein
LALWQPVGIAKLLPPCSEAVTSFYRSKANQKIHRLCKLLYQVKLEVLAALCHVDAVAFMLIFLVHFNQLI